jgi:hypothetical protein
MARKKWERVVFSADCDEETGDCPNCGIDYAECDCIGPTEDDVEYKFDKDGVMWGRRV